MSNVGIVTVKEILDEVALYAGSGGSCPDSPKVIKHLNAAQRLLWNRGDWLGTIEYASINPAECHDCCVFTLPWHIEHVRKAWICNKPIEVQNRWYEGLSWAGVKSCCGSCCDTELIDVGEIVPTAFPLPHGGAKIQTRPTAWREETGTIEFRGLDAYGHSMSWTADLSLESDQSPENFHTITAAIKGRTTGPVQVMWRNTKEYRMEGLLAIYHKEQENPAYSRYKAAPIPSVDHPVLIKGKRRCIPLKDENDRLYISNVVALQFAMSAVSEQRNGNLIKFAEYLNLAEENLEEDIEDATGDKFQPIDLELSPPVSNFTPTRW